MPELPEVQTIVTGLADHILHQQIQTCEIYRESLINGDPQKFIQTVEGQSIHGINRRGKYLVFEFSSGLFMVVHLRMTGKFVFQQGEPVEKHPHDRVLFLFEEKNHLVFSDVRCFGTLELCKDLNEIPALQKLGVEPLEEEFTWQLLESYLEKKNTAIKNFLLDQSVIVGIGNIYASEILFDCQIHPERNSRSFTREEIKNLHASIQEILTLAIQHNGTSISDYRRVDEKTGEFQNFLKVYGKTNQRCKQCNEIIVQKKQMQRTTFFCPHCQQ